MTTRLHHGKEAFAGLLAEHILAAAESTGLRATGRIVALASMENRVFAVECHSDERGKSPALQVVVKFYRPERWTREQLHAEHALAQLLQVENFSTPHSRDVVDASLRWDADNSFARLFAPGVPWKDFKRGTLGSIGGFAFCVWDKVAGRAPLEMTPDDLCRTGRLVARMHTLYESSLRRDAFVRLRLSVETHLFDAVARLEVWGHIPRGIESLLFDAAEVLIRGLEWVDDCIDFVPLHGDLHRLNLIQTHEGGDFWLVDFDDALLGPEIQDLWLLASGCDVSAHVPEGSHLRSLDFLVKGYSELRRLPEGSEELVEPLRTLRLFHYLGWIAKRWNDDEQFRKTFPFFATEQHWETVLQDVENQKSELEASGLLQF